MHWGWMNVNDDWNIFARSNTMTQILGHHFLQIVLLRVILMWLNINPIQKRQSQHLETICWREADRKEWYIRRHDNLLETWSEKKNRKFFPVITYTNWCPLSSSWTGARMYKLSHRCLLKSKHLSHQILRNILFYCVSTGSEMMLRTAISSRNVSTINFIFQYDYVFLRCLFCYNDVPKGICECTAYSATASNGEHRSMLESMLLCRMLSK